MILRDLNYPNINWTEWTTDHNETHPELQFTECLSDKFLSQEIRKPTRYRVGETVNALDLLLVDKSEIVSDMQFSSALKTSDHLSYSAYVISNPDMRDSNTVKFNFHKGDYASISEALQIVD